MSVPRRITTIMQCAFIGAGFALLVSCSPHSVNYDPAPSVEAGSAFVYQPEDGKDGEVFTRPWWEHLDRPLLNALIERSFENNYNLKQQLAVLKQARAQARNTGADRLPQISAQGSADKSWRGSEEQRGSSEIGAAMAWELDVFDRIGSALEADELEALARREDVEAAKLSLSADIANAYFASVAADLRLKLLRDQLGLDEDLEELLQFRLDSGVGTNVDVLQQQARVAESETLIPLAEAARAVNENRLDILLGQAPDGKARVEADEDLDFKAALPPIGVPAALLLNRPDLRAARAELVAADADIAAAIADRLPQLTLQGSYLSVDSLAYNGPVSTIIGSFVQPLIDWGKRRAEVERNEALYEERLAAYTQLYLEAVEDVENALVQERKQRDYLERLRARRDVLQETVQASESRYKQGVEDYLTVINSLKELRQVERDLIDEKLALLQYRIALFRAIGGPVSAAPEKRREETRTDQKQEG